jgi:Phage tail protein
VVQPTLNEWEFQLADDGERMGGGLTYDVDTADGFDSAEVRVIEQDRDGSDGSYIFAQFTKSRSIALSGFIRFDPSDPFTTIDRLKANWQPSASPKPFYFKPRGRTQRVAFGYPLGIRYPMDANFNAGYVPFQAQLICEDPRIYESLASQAGPTGLATTGGGRIYPKVYPHAYGTIVSGGSLSVVNSGNTYSFPTIIISGAATTPIVQNLTDNTLMRFNIALGTGDQLIIDTALRSIKFNGSDRVDILHGVDFIKLLPGTNSLLFTAQNFTSTGAITVLYRNAWR